MEEGWGDGDAQGLGCHPGLGALAVAVDHSESTEQEDQDLLGIGRQGREHTGKKKKIKACCCKVAREMTY